MQSRDEIIHKLNNIHHFKYDYSKCKDINWKDKFEVICHCKDKNGLEHGSFFISLTNHLSNKRGCPVCGRERTKNGRILKREDFISKSKEIHGDKYDYSQTDVNERNLKGCIKIICIKHGEFWQLPHNHYKYGCPQCGKEISAKLRSKSVEEFIKEAKDTHFDEYEYDLASYINYHSKMHIKHNKCGKWFTQKPVKHINAKQGCPFCCLSKGQKKIVTILDKHDIEYIIEYSNDNFKNGNGKQKIDIFLPAYNLGIEFHGIQHFKQTTNIKFQNLEKQIMLDNRKKEVCSKLNIRLLYVVDSIKDINYEISLYTKDNTIELNDFENWLNNNL